MKYKQDKIKDIVMAYIGGDSRAWAMKLMQDLALEPSIISGTMKLFDIDNNAAKENETIGNELTSRKETKGKWNYKTVSTIEEAIKDTDFIVISILPGTFKEMAYDVHTPEKYGTYQPVGDTTGPGGLMRALRTIPIYADFAEKIKKYSLNAWVINYTNPMASCTRILYEVFPEIRAFGCCHEVFNTQEVLIAMLKDLKKIDTVTREEININVLGINHFTWIDKASYKGIDLFPLYREFVDKYFKDGFEVPGKEEWTESIFSSANRVKFDLFNKYGIIAADDRHLAEFMPPWYIKDPEIVKSWKFRLTTIDFRIENLKKNK